MIFNPESKSTVIGNILTSPNETLITMNIQLSTPLNCWLPVEIGCVLNEADSISPSYTLFFLANIAIRRVNHFDCLFYTLYANKRRTMLSLHTVEETLYYMIIIELIMRWEKIENGSEKMVSWYIFF